MTGTNTLSDGKEIIKAIEMFQASTRTFWGACVGASLPEFSVGKVKQGYVNANKRGVRILYITEITYDNLRYCMEIMRFAELRHLDGVRGNFAVSDSAYIAGIMRGNMLSILVQSDLKELVKQQRHVFDTLWKHAMPADKRINQLRWQLKHGH